MDGYPIGEHGMKSINIKMTVNLSTPMNKVSIL